MRNFAQEFFKFWPEGEDLIWCKTVWPALEHAGLFSDFDDDALAWTRSKIAALSILYAESACRFGTPDYQHGKHLDRASLMKVFGSEDDLDETLREVGSIVRNHFAPNLEREADFFTPLIRSLVTGSGNYFKGPELQDYLLRVRAVNFGHCDMCEFREDELYRMLIGGDFKWKEMSCFP